MTVTCPYCSAEAELTTGDYIYPHRPDLSHLKVYVCWPCDAYVGTHKNTNPPQPLGRLANAELRKARRAAHDAFDPLWDRTMSRRAAYAWLAKQMGLPKDQTHIAMFDVDQCKQVVELVNNR